MRSDCQQTPELCLITQFVLTRGDLTSFNFCFDEMKENIIEVDYVKTNNLQKSNSSLYIKTFYGYTDMLIIHIEKSASLQTNKARVIPNLNRLGLRKIKNQKDF